MQMALAATRLFLRCQNTFSTLSQNNQFGYTLQNVGTEPPKNPGGGNADENLAIRSQYERMAFDFASKGAATSSSGASSRSYDLGFKC